jgi:hypothetical protein
MGLAVRGMGLNSPHHGTDSPHHGTSSPHHGIGRSASWDWQSGLCIAKSALQPTLTHRSELCHSTQPYGLACQPIEDGAGARESPTLLAANGWDVRAEKWARHHPCGS